VLFLHGNAENISTHLAAVYWLPARGFNALLLDYSGYGASEGAPSLAGLQEDIAAAMRWLTAAPAIDPGRLVVFGQSLGAAAAITFVARSPHRRYVRALIADSAFASYRGIVREKLASFWLTWPFQWLAWSVPDDLSPLAAIADVSPIPLLLVHGERDTIVPVAHARRLYAAAREPKALWLVEHAGHIGAFGSEVWRERLVRWLSARVCPERDPA
jgi:fermentation-respiration switch protein FrsA (DUF1100 family)